VVDGGGRLRRPFAPTYTPTRLLAPLRAREARNVYSRDDPCGRPKNGALSLPLVRMGGNLYGRPRPVPH
jgi:hypothetical protein